MYYDLIANHRLGAIVSWALKQIREVSIKNKNQARNADLNAPIYELGLYLSLLCYY